MGGAASLKSVDHLADWMAWVGNRGWVGTGWLDGSLANGGFETLMVG